MSTGKVWVIVLPLVLFLFACATPQQDAAEAAQIATRTADEHKARVTKEERTAQNWTDQRGAWIFFKRAILYAGGVSGIFLFITCCMIFCVRFWQWSGARIRAARVESMRLFPDQVTGSLGGFLTRGFWHNLETGEAFSLGSMRPTTPQRITASTFLRALFLGTKANVEIARITGQDQGPADGIGTLVGALPLIEEQTPGDRLREAQGRASYEK